MKRERIALQGGITVETGRDWNGRFYVAYGRGTSVFLRCPKAVKRFLEVPVGSTSEAALDSWLESLAAAKEDLSASPEG